jgi:hypothetical protein
MRADGPVREKHELNVSVNMPFATGFVVSIPANKSDGIEGTLNVKAKVLLNMLSAGGP